MITVLVVGGTGESHPGDTRTEVSGLMQVITDQLDPTRFVAKWVPYPATYGNGHSYAMSRNIGITNLLAAIDTDPNPVILLGYSQGAAIVGDTADQLWLHPNLDVRGVALVADPARHRSQIFGPDPGGYGVVGERHLSNTDYPVWSVAAIGDPICALPAGNPLRSIADLTEFMSTTDPRQWALSLVERAKAKQFQRWWDISNMHSWAGAIAYARGYLLDNRHVMAYVWDGHLDRLATAINTVQE